MAESIADSVQRFLSYVRRKGSPGSRTPENYAWALGKLQRFCDQLGVSALDELTEPLLEAWQDGLLNAGLAPKSRALAHTAVRSWLRWLEERDLVSYRLLRSVVPVSAPAGEARPIDKRDVALILEHLGPRPQGLRELRDRALWLYLLVTSARISEALQVRRADWQDAVIQQKGGRRRRLRVTETVRAAITDYLAERQDDSIWLWVTSQAGLGDLSAIARTSHSG